MKRYKIKGFTLVELLIVIAIISILSSVGVVYYNGTQKGARDAKRKTDIQAIAQALENHHNSFTNQYCGTVSSPVNAGTYCAPQTSWFAGGGIPKDPSTSTDYSGLPSEGATTYNVCATLEEGGSYCRSNQQ